MLATTIQTPVSKVMIQGVSLAEEKKANMLQPVLSEDMTQQISCCDHIFNLRIFSRYDKVMLEKTGILSGMLPPLTCYGDIVVSGERLSGIAVRNINRGYEFYNPSVMTRPFTIGRYGILHIRKQEKSHKQTCRLFFDFLDYSAFWQLSPVLPASFNDESDSIVVNHSNNFIHAMLIAELYERIYCYLPNDDFGKCMFETIKGRNPDKCFDHSYQYKKERNVFDFLKNQTI